MTEFIREKINTLNNLIMQFSLEMYQNQLLIEDASKGTGDMALDQQLAAQAQNAKGIVLVSQRRIDVRKAELEKLSVELEASQKVKQA